MNGGFSLWGLPEAFDPLPSSPTPEDVLQIFGRGGLAPHTNPLPGAPRVCLWVQPTGSQKHHCQSAAP